MAFIRGTASYDKLYKNAENIVQQLSSSNMEQSARLLLDISEKIAGMNIASDKKESYYQLLLSGQSGAANGSNIQKTYNMLIQLFLDARGEFKQSLPVNNQQSSITHRPKG